eukprot:gene37694-24088_t
MRLRERAVCAIAGAFHAPPRAVCAIAAGGLATPDGRPLELSRAGETAQAPGNVTMRLQQGGGAPPPAPAPRADEPVVLHAPRRPSDDSTPSVVLRCVTSPTSPSRGVSSTRFSAASPSHMHSVVRPAPPPSPQATPVDDALVSPAVVSVHRSAPAPASAGMDIRDVCEVPPGMLRTWPHRGPVRVALTGADEPILRPDGGAPAPLCPLMYTGDNTEYTGAVVTQSGAVVRIRCRAYIADSMEMELSQEEWLQREKEWMEKEAEREARKQELLDAIAALEEKYSYLEEFMDSRPLLAKIIYDLYKQC